MLSYCIFVCLLPLLMYDCYLLIHVLINLNILYEQRT